MDRLESRKTSNNTINDIINKFFSFLLFLLMLMSFKKQFVELWINIRSLSTIFEVKLNFHEIKINGKVMQHDAAVL